MFKKASVADEVISNFKQHYEDAKSLETREKHAKFSKAVECLTKAADILDEVGLQAFADDITTILGKVSWEVPTNDPATSGLTSEQMEKNLAEKGWVFNADDGQVLEVAEVSGDEVPQLNDTDGTIEVEDDTAEVDVEPKLDFDKTASEKMPDQVRALVNHINHILTEQFVASGGDVFDKQSYDKYASERKFIDHKDGVWTIKNLLGPLFLTYSQEQWRLGHKGNDWSPVISYQEADANIESMFSNPKDKTVLAHDERDERQDELEWLSILQDSENEEALDPEGLGLSYTHDPKHKIRVSPMNWKSDEEMTDEEYEENLHGILRPDEERVDADLSEFSDEDMPDEDGDSMSPESRLIEQVRSLKDPWADPEDQELGMFSLYRN